MHRKVRLRSALSMTHQASERARVGVSGLEADILCGIGPIDADERGDWLVR
jgi:hypothetical protein